MTKIITETKNNVIFEKQINGYDRDQVDRYITNLAQAYQTAYDEYVSVCGKNDDLLKEINGLNEQIKNTPNADAITRALVNAEILAQKIIEDAKSESEKIIADTHAETKKLIDDAYVEKAAVKIQLEKFIEDNKAEAARIMSEANKDLITVQEKKALLITEINGIISRLKSLGLADGTYLSVSP